MFKINTIDEKSKQIQKYKEQKNLIELEIKALEDQVEKEKFENQQIQVTFIISNKINKIIKERAKKIKQSPSGAVEFLAMNYKEEE